MKYIEVGNTECSCGLNGGGCKGSWRLAARVVVGPQFIDRNKTKYLASEQSWEYIAVALAECKVPICQCRENTSSVLCYNASHKQNSYTQFSYRLYCPLSLFVWRYALTCFLRSQSQCKQNYHLFDVLSSVCVCACAVLPWWGQPLLGVLVSEREFVKGSPIHWSMRRGFATLWRFVRLLSFGFFHFIFLCLLSFVYLPRLQASLLL